ncbi:predicted protein [Naegleria gruberi]|uniref:Predicted protein n=1 Tax=Naegleria gruberi TaxID=5762 RepID=D2VYT7_NAEGR|nr:uncharacterized protein NAEGRDRAFT_74237 [Naegleria gruberi]EFC38014.1 predicted protein [Naegleria gruberi]|eukprot:XP_002670758.1 predicted protein [Naegleria gruberi strain NEG-M]
MNAKPKFEQLSTKYPNTNFVSVDVDQSQDIASQYSVSSLPTFLFFKAGSKLGQIVGADMDKVEDMIKKHGTNTSPGAFPSGGGRVLGSSASSSTTYNNLQASGGRGGLSDLFDPLVRQANGIPVEQRPLYFLGFLILAYFVIKSILKMLF